MSGIKQSRAKVKKNKMSFKQWIARHKKLLIIVLIVVLIGYGIPLFAYAKFVFHTVRCGGVPVSINPGSAFMGGSASSYILPGDTHYTISANKRYVCTEYEARSMNIEMDHFSEKYNKRYR